MLQLLQLLQLLLLRALQQLKEVMVYRLGQKPSERAVSVAKLCG